MCVRVFRCVSENAVICEKTNNKVRMRIKELALIINLIQMIKKVCTSNLPSQGL